MLAQGRLHGCEVVAHARPLHWQEQVWINESQLVSGSGGPYAREVADAPLRTSSNAVECSDVATRLVLLATILAYRFHSADDRTQMSFREVLTKNLSCS